MSLLQGSPGAGGHPLPAAFHEPFTGQMRKKRKDRPYREGRSYETRNRKQGDKPGYVWCDHLSRTAVASRLEQPTRSWRAASSLLLGLASDGVYMAAPVTSRTVVSYTAFPPLPGSPGGIFLLHFPGSRLHRLLAGILPCEARTFLSRILRFGKAFLLARFCAAKRLPCIRQRSHTLLSRPYYSDFKGVSARPMKVPANKGLQSKSNESR